VGFDQFVGNRGSVDHLREAIAGGRMPPALILAGQRGAGKYTLAIMLSQAMACREHPITNGLPDFCGVCSNCVRIALSLPLAERVKEAVAAREELRETDKKDTRILIQTHPDLLVIPPDPPQLMIKIGQVRSVIQRLYRLPAEAPSSLYIFTSAAFMKEAANSLLKALEEPPEYAHILLLAENPGALLPTIRSRSHLFRLDTLPEEEIAAVLQQRRPDWSSRDRALVARLSDGAMGQALGFDLEGYLKNRQDALVFLHNAIGGPGTRNGDSDFASLFRVTETYRAGVEGQERLTGLLGALRSLLEDVLLIFSGAAQLVRNIDLTAELTRIAESVSMAWIETTARALAEVEQGVRRNLLRSLSLDSLAINMIPE
jgi:DNA polymerase III subunit delta'